MPCLDVMTRSDRDEISRYSRADRRQNRTADPKLRSNAFATRPIQVMRGRNSRRRPLRGYHLSQEHRAQHDKHYIEVRGSLSQRDIISSQPWQLTDYSIDYIAGTRPFQERFTIVTKS